MARSSSSAAGGVLIAFAALLELAAGTGLAYVTGFSRVRSVPGDVQWGWLVVLAVSLAVYYFAYRGIFRVDGGPEVPGRQMRAVVAAGFGGLFAHGRGALDQYVLEAAAAGGHEARARATGLAGLVICDESRNRRQDGSGDGVF